MCQKNLPEQISHNDGMEKKKILFFFNILQSVSQYLEQCHVVEVMT